MNHNAIKINRLSLAAPTCRTIKFIRLAMAISLAISSAACAVSA